MFRVEDNEVKVHFKAFSSTAPQGSFLPGSISYDAMANVLVRAGINLHPKDREKLVQLTAAEHSTARSNLDWKTHLSLSMDPKTATRMYDEACQGERKDEVQGANFCTMCGEHWCSVRVNKEIREAACTTE